MRLLQCLKKSLVKESSSGEKTGFEHGGAMHKQLSDKTIETHQNHYVKQLKRIVIDVFLDLMRHLLREIEITCNRGLSGFHWK